MLDEPSVLCDQLLVDFPTRRRRRPTVHFASTAIVFPVRSALTMIRHNEELWYSKRDEETMKMQMRLEAAALRRTVLQEGDVHVSQAVGLEKSK